MSSCVCKISLKSVQVCGGCCKMFRGLTFFGTQCSFLMPKIYAKLDRGHPLWGHQMQVGWVEISDFRQITGYISKMVQDRCMVSIKVE